MGIKESLQQVKNPLTMIAIFAGLAEIAATVVLPVLNGAVQSTFVWYVMLFPVFLVVCFFITLNFNHKVLYAPSDFKDERHFFDELHGDFTAETSEIEKLRKFWKPDGVVDRFNENRLKQWLKISGIDPESITFFLRNKAFSDARKKAVEDLQL
ncbi:hypothetical protein [Nitrosomonas supralitoralis]|uniref:Uncharacterized protein n=1 Tax=Nitrosomonas supralitoralis TaxID=2116706 RepID=A0A2P7NV13_9PROT|nr:hypothetical protein [Nitrosomonas supralitoralis]PSJ17310.1 hypothetical protein C7H79_08985 [Nitrosomonas supralitoralis]